MLGITIALGILAAIISVWGGIMSDISKKNKALFIGIGLVMLVLIIIQAIINDRNIRDRDNNITEMSISISNMEGQLTSFRELMASFLTSPAGIMKKSPEQLPKSVKELSNLELKNKVIELSKNMIDFETNHQKEERKLYDAPLEGTEDEKHKQWQQQTNMMMQRSLEYRNEFKKIFLSDSIIYRDELLNRLNLLPPEEEKDIIALKGFLAGPSPVSELAIYLERLAKKL